MRETLVIRFAAFPAPGVDYIVTDEAGALVGAVKQGSLTEAAIETSGRRVVVLVPAADLLLTQVAIPSSNRQRVRKALPYALEDLLAQDIEDLHFALGSRSDDGHWPVAVTARARMEYWLEQLREAGIHPDRVLPEPLALPFKPGGVSLLFEDGRVLLRDQVCSAQALSVDALADVLALLAGRAEGAPPLQVWHCAGELPDMSENFAIDMQDGEQGGLAVLAKGVTTIEPSIDLLQGAYSRKEHYGQLWRPWRAAAALLLVSVLVGGVQQGLQYRSLKVESNALKADIAKLYGEIFPGGRLVDARVQMEQQLKALRRQQGTGQTDFLGLVGKMGGALAAAQGIELIGANFRDGRLDLELTANDVQTLDRLKQALNETGGLSVDIQSATAGANQRVQGRLRVQGTES